MSAELDLRRLAELERVLGQTVPEIVATLVHELDSAMRAAGDALDAEDLPAAALAAHAARNSALMIDAGPLLLELEAIEVGARSGDLAVAAQARGRLEASWPAWRSQLESAGRGS